MTNSAVTIPFTLPDGREVSLHSLDQSDFDALCDWIKQTYLNDVSIATSTMPKNVRLKYIKRALDTTTASDFLSTKGHKILFSTTEGLARIGYQMIDDKRTIPFESFLQVLFPSKMFIVGGPASLMNGYAVLDKMISAVYESGKIDFSNKKVER